MSFYIHVFVFIGVNIVLQLFVGIVVNNYNEHKPNHSALLTVSQKRWSDLVERIALTRPIKKPPEPREWQWVWFIEGWVGFIHGLFSCVLELTCALLCPRQQLAEAGALPCVLASVLS